MPDQNQSGAGRAQSPRLAIVGAGTLKGKELKEALEERNWAPGEIRLMDDDESLGQLDAIGDEPTFIQPVTPDLLEAADIVFFASDAGFVKQHWKQAKDAGCSVVDLSYALEEVTGVPVRSPWLDHELRPGEAAVDLKTSAVIAAHPVAVMLGLLLTRAGKAARVLNVAATIYEPASEEGKKGMDELHQQTLNLLSFQPLPKEIFDAQVAFNLSSQHGPEAKSSLEATAWRVARHLREITRGRVTTPALQMVQAATFHGYAVSIMLEVDTAGMAEVVAAALKGEHVIVTGDDEERPSNVSAAGQAEFMVSVRADANRENIVWLWVAADNLKISAMHAVECAQGLMAARPTGKIQ